MNLLSLLILYFPGKIYFIRFFFEFITTLFFILFYRRINIIMVIVFFIFMISILFLSFYNYNYDLYENLIRIFSFFLAYFVVKSNRFNIKKFFILGLFVNLIFVFINLLDYNYYLNSFIYSNPTSFYHERQLGAFSNLGAFSYFCFCSCLYFIFECKARYTFESILYLILSFLLLFLSQSKTALIIILSYLLIITIFKLQIKTLLIMVFCFFILLIALENYAFFLKENFYFIFKLIDIFESLNSSSFNARVELWRTYFNIYISDINYIIYGVPNYVLNKVSNTYDNDYVWMIINFGLFGFLLILLVFSFVLFIFFKNGFNSFLIIIILSLIFMNLISVIAVPQSSLIFYILLFKAYHEKNI